MGPYAGSSIGTASIESPTREQRLQKHNSIFTTFQPSSETVWEVRDDVAILEDGEKCVQKLRDSIRLSQIGTSGAGSPCGGPPGAPIGGPPGGPSGGPPAPPKLSKARMIALVATVTGAAFLNTLCVQAAVIVLPTIGKDLNIPASRQQWVVSSYALTFGCFLLLWGRLGDLYGKRLVFLYGSAWFTITSVIIPFLPNEISFDVMRGLQGLGGAANVPTAIGILGVTFPPGKAKIYAFSFYGAGAPLGSVFGNIIGGVVGEYLSWKWVFWVLAILAACVTVAGYFFIPLPPLHAGASQLKSSVDWIGGTLVTVGLLALMFALTEANVVGWSTSYIPVLIETSIVLIAVFVLWQWYLENKTARQPLMRVSIFRSTKFSGAMMIMLLFVMSFNNYNVLATYFYQEYLGLSVIQTTLRFVPTGVGGIMIAFINAQLLSRVRGNYIAMFGTICVSIASLLFAVPIPPATTYWAYGFPAMILSVCGMDTLYPCLILFTAQSLPQSDQALGGALINAVGQVGRAVGLAIATAAQTAVIAHEQGAAISEVGKAGSRVGEPALLSGLRVANWIDFGLGIAAFAVVLFAFNGAGKVGAMPRR